MSHISNKYEPEEFDPTLSRLVTPGMNRKQPVYRWYVYPHSFARELVQHVLEELELKPGSIVLDPCVGAGSTILSCKERGVSAIGYDILPLSVLITNVKARNYHAKKLRETWESFLSTGWDTTGSSIRRSNVPFLSKAFDSTVLDRIYQIRDAIYAVKNPKYRNFFFLGLAATVGGVSKTAKGGGWLRLMPDKAYNVQDVDSIFTDKVEKMIEDIEMSPIRAPHQGIWGAFRADARSLPSNNTFSAAITSPPYLNRHDYTRIFLLELAIPFLMTEKGLKRLRYKTLRSHVEARRQFGNGKYSQPGRLTDVLKELQDRHLNNVRLPDMIAGYFEDMYLMLHELHRVTNSGGKVVFVLGNVRFGGVMVPVDEITAEIGEQVGFRWDNTIIARHRGNSAQQMGTFSREPSRECLIYWSKP